MRSKQRVQAAAMLLASGLIAPGVARAALISFEFGGVITEAEYTPPYLDLEVLAGQRFSGRITYDSDAPQDPFGIYFHELPYDTAIGIDLELNGAPFSTLDSSPFTILVQDTHTSLFLVRTSVFDPQSGFGIPLFFELEDSTGTAFSDFSLPTMLSLEDFDTAQLLSAVVVLGETRVIFGGTIDSLAKVPEPGSGGLLGLGLTALALRRRVRAQPGIPTR